MLYMQRVFVVFILFYFKGILNKMIWLTESEDGAEDDARASGHNASVLYTFLFVYLESEETKL